jgi:DNA-binding NtrC family response regulator
MNVVGESEAFLATRRTLRRYAACDAPVLLEGETGTGKELAAREIHYLSRRAGGPFVPVNCGALPDSLVESELFGHQRGAFTDARESQRGLIAVANGGTILLDEVDSLSPKAQVTLLRFLQDHEYRPLGAGVARAADVRVVAATNASLRDLSQEGGLRRDLLYRLNPLYVRLPPLRERAGDVPLLATHFLAAAADRLGGPAKRWSAEAVDVLARHVWPGNVRELENVALRAYLRADGTVVGCRDLADVEPALPLLDGAAECAEPAQRLSVAKSRAIELFERRYLTDVMRRASGNVSQAARLAGTERRHLGKLLKKHHLEHAAFRRG